MQSYVRTIIHGYKGKWSIGSSDHHLLLVDDLHCCHRRHLACAHHSPGDRIGEGWSPCKYGARYDLCWCSAGPHQVNILRDTERSLQSNRIPAEVLLNRDTKYMNLEIIHWITIQWTHVPKYVGIYCKSRIEYHRHDGLIGKSGNREKHECQRESSDQNNSINQISLWFFHCDISIVNQMVPAPWPSV